MRFGLQLAPLADASLAQSCAHAIHVAAVAEKFDFDILIAPQHYGSPPYSYPHALTLATYLASRTNKWVGTGVLPLALLGPIDLAEQLSTLAGLAGGRCVLGVGLGYRPEEFALLGVPWAERRSRFETNLAAIRQYWHRSAGVAPPLANDSLLTGPGVEEGGQIPIWIGASARPGIVRAARAADGWLVAPTTDLPELRDGLTLYRTATREAGRRQKSPLPVRRDVLITGGGAAGRRAAAMRVAQRYGTYSAWRGVAAADGTLAAAVGTADEVIAALHLLQETVQGDVLAILRLAWPGMTTRDVVEQVRLVGTQIIPRLRTGSGALTPAIDP